MTDYSFKEHQVSDTEALWLCWARDPSFNARIERIKRWTRLPEDFDPQSIDRRLYVNDRTTPVGRWHADQNDPLFERADKVVRHVRDVILVLPEKHEFSAEGVAAALNYSVEAVGGVFFFLGELGGFFASASGKADAREYSVINLDGENVKERYLRYKGMSEELERYYVGRQFRTNSADSFFLPIDDGIASAAAEALPSKANTAFVLMAIDPNNSQLEKNYDAISKACKELGIAAMRADKIEHQSSITNRVLKEISECEFLIADLSLERPNVYYEIGFAHGINKEPILFRSAGTRLHFDLSVHNVPEYQDAAELGKLVRRRLSAMLADKANLLRRT